MRNGSQTEAGTGIPVATEIEIGTATVTETETVTEETAVIETEETAIETGTGAAIETLDGEGEAVGKARRTKGARWRTGSATSPGWPMTEAAPAALAAPVALAVPVAPAVQSVQEEGKKCGKTAETTADPAASLLDHLWTVPLGDRCPSAGPTDNPHSAVAEGPTDHPRPAPSDGSDPVDPTAEDRDLETGHPTAECLPTTCLSTGRPDRWGTPWAQVVRWEGQWDTRGRLTAHPGDISTGRQARDPSTAQDPEDPLRDLSAVGLLGHLAVQVHLMAQADRVRLTGQADPWEGLLAPSAVLVHPSEMGSVEAAAAVAAWGEAAWDEADLETDQAAPGGTTDHP